MSDDTMRPDEEPEEVPAAEVPDVSPEPASEQETPGETPVEPVAEDAPLADAPQDDHEAGGTGSTPGWVPAAVVAGVVLLVEAFIVLQIRPEGGEGTPDFIGDLASVSGLLGGVSLLTGYFFFLRARLSLASAFEAFALSGLTVVLYGMCWRTLVGALTLNSETLFFVEPLGLVGKMANLAGIVGLVCFVLGFAWSFQQTAKLVWPFFRRGVALNVLAMLHLVVLLLGFVSALNMKYTARVVGTGMDLTETNEFSLTDPTKKLLGEIEGQLDILLLDAGGLRGSTLTVTSKVRDLLGSFEAAGANVNFRKLDLFKDPEGTIKVLQELGLESVRDSLTGEEDVVALAYRVPGERLPSRTKVVPVNQEFTDVSALGNTRFRGEGILMNAVKEVVFVQRRVYFTVGHGEKPVLGGATPAASIKDFSESLRQDNFSVATLDFKSTSTVPEDADLVVVAGPTTAYQPAEAEALRAYLGRGGSVVLLLDVEADPAGRRTGLEDLLSAWGLEAKRDFVAVTYLTQRTAFGEMTGELTEILVGRKDYGRH
ncbi:MAG: Gldg family protein, partial [Planctomycetota bacterium]